MLYHTTKKLYHTTCQVNQNGGNYRYFTGKRETLRGNRLERRRRGRRVLAGALLLAAKGKAHLGTTRLRRSGALGKLDRLGGPSLVQLAAIVTDGVGELADPPPPSPAR